MDFKISMAKLVVISDEMKGQVFELEGSKISVGRLPDNQICLDNNAVSSHHAELVLKGHDYVVHDLNSTNGTRVNGQRVVESRLHHGDMINFSHVQLQYLSTIVSTPKPLPSPLKKTIDLSNIKVDTTPRSTTFSSSSPFAKPKQKKKGRKIFWLLGLLVGLGLVFFFIYVIIQIIKS